MSRYIEADALKRALCNHCDGEQPCTEPCVDIGLIETAPTVDAVPVVRCKDCVHRDPEDKRCDCGGHEWFVGKIVPVADDFYCADGERKDGEHEERNTIR